MLHQAVLALPMVLQLYKGPVLGLAGCFPVPYGSTVVGFDVEATAPSRGATIKN